MAIIKSNTENIELAVKKLKGGEIVAFPTETVYGLGADGMNEIAVSKIFEAKQRPSFNPLILHVSSLEMLSKVASFTSDKIKLLTDKFWPGPLTLVLKKKDIVPYIVTSGLETVAVRMPNNKVALDLINNFGKPIAAPSANSFSQLSPTEAEHVEKQLGDKVDIILDGGKCNVGVESTIIEVTETSQLLLRPGGIAREEIEELIEPLSDPEKTEQTPNSPGQLKIHYAPIIPIQFYDEENLKKYSNLKIGGIFFSEAKQSDKFVTTRVLSKKKELHEAASNLFSHLHDLETQDLDLILVEEIEQKGLGIAIMDRLTKAVNKYL